ncbi:hypothetical protein APICC_05978 [Apis cerana cerana]|uniref:Uncharacterized protein n=1 Tax=Apis cerana cerana TaxID=94128 RepID=A0A2A3E0J1_APICC|nr:hypothetical protein APICC_05978 [Apis cerana cerana]
MIVVILGPGKNTYSCQYIVVVVVCDINFESKIIVCKAINFGRDRHICDLGCVVNSIDEAVLELFKVGLKAVAEGYAFDGDSRKLEVLLGVGGKTVLVLPEDVIHVLVEAEESRIARGGLEVLQHTRREGKLAMRVALAAKHDMSGVVQGAVVLGVGADQHVTHARNAVHVLELHIVWS